MIKNEEEPLALCGAKSKRTGFSCRQPAMKNGKCRLHGGKSTGPRTAKGLLRVKQSKTKHSFYSKEANEERRQVRVLIKRSKQYLNDY